MPLHRLTRACLASCLLLTAGAGFTAATAATPAAASTASDSVAITDSINTQTIKKNPKNVVVYDLAILEILDVLDVKVSGLSLPQKKGSFPPFLSQYESGPYYNAGNPFKPDFETLRKEKPDLIIGGERAFESTDKFREIAPTLEMTLDHAHLLQSLEQRTRSLGELFDRQPQAEAAIKALEEDVNKVRPLAEKAGTAMTILTTGDKLMGYGSGGKYGFIADFIGFKDATPLTHNSRFGEVIDSARIAKANPQWIFVIDRDSVLGKSPDYSNAKKLLDNADVKGTDAAKNNRIIYLNAQEIYGSGGITTYRNQAQRIYQLLKDAK